MALTKFAIHHPYKDRAENESAARIIEAAKAFDVDVIETGKAQEILDFSPDFVLSLSHQEPKLTPFPTYGVLTAPVRWYNTPRFVRNILTYDGYLTVTPGTKQWLQDMCFGIRKLDMNIGFYANTVSAMTESQPKDFANAHLLYVGSGWDGQRYAGLFHELEASGSIDIRGRSDAWQAFPDAYKGPLIFDGKETLAAYAMAGVGLCIEHPDFVLEGVPSSRVFETLAAGAIAIVSRSVFNETWFGDTALYVDTTLPPSKLVNEILAHLDQIKNNPDEASLLARRGHEKYNQTFALDKMLQSLFAYHEKQSVAKGYRTRSDDLQSSKIDVQAVPKVAYIVRAGDRPERFLRRALSSLMAQTYTNIVVYVVLWSDVDRNRAICEDFPDLNIRIVEHTGGSRSSCLWAGLKHAKQGGCDFIGILDDDDELHPNAVQALYQTYQYHAKLSLPMPVSRVTGGSLKAFEKAVELPFGDMHDSTSLISKQTRHIDHFHVGTGGEANSFAFSSAPASTLIVAKYVDSEILQNPELDLAEDYYLWLLLAERGRTAFAPEIIASMHVHDSPQSGYASNKKTSQDNHLRITHRVFGRHFSPTEFYQGNQPNHMHTGTTFGAPIPVAISDNNQGARSGGNFEPVETAFEKIGDYEAVWIYGASNFGERMLAVLNQKGYEVTGVADGYKHGTLGRYDIKSIGDLAEEIHEGECIFIASIHWREIAKELEALSVENALFTILDPTNHERNLNCNKLIRKADP